MFSSRYFRPLRACTVACHSFVLLFVAGREAQAQVRERPVPFDTAGRVDVITPPLAARLGLVAPAWPVAGDYLDARLYVLDEIGSSFVLVVRRQREILDRYPLTAQQTRDLATAIDRGNTVASARGGPDVVPTYISEPVRGTFVANQTLLGAFLFGPAASAIMDDPAAGGAAYLAVTGASFFMSATWTATNSVSRAQNHLAWHSARRGAIAADLALYSLTGVNDGQAQATAIFVGGIAGDALGYVLAEPMTDAEAHGTSHGSTVSAALATGVLGMTGALDGSAGRLSAGLVVGAGAIGYPLGLQYVRTAPYRVTAGDIGTLVTTEFLGLGLAATILPEHADGKLVSAALTAGFALGAIAGDRWLVRPYDHTESEARLLQYGSAAGALVGLALPVLTQADNANVTFGAATVGGILGAILTEQLIEPQRAREIGSGAAQRSSRAIPSTGVDVNFAPESLILAGMGVKGNHPVLSITF